MSDAATAWAHPRRLAEWLGHGLDVELVSRMTAVPRLQARCSRLIDRRLGEVVQASATQAVALSLDGFGVIGLMQQAGAIWHGRSIIRVIDGADVRSLVGEIGPGLRMLAIRHAALAPLEVEPQAAGTLPAFIAEDGLRCVIAWCLAQPGAVGRRLLLRLPQVAEPDARHRASGPPIVDALLAGVP